MDEYIVKGESLTAIADKIRVLSGVSGGMGLDDMANEVGNANDDVDTEASLIAQIATALEGKSAGGGNSATTASVTVYAQNGTRFIYIGENGLSNIENVTKTVQMVVPSICLVQNGNMFSDLPFTNKNTEQLFNNLYTACAYVTGETTIYAEGASTGGPGAGA